MFDNLSNKLDKAFKTLKGQGSITEINVAQTIKEIRRALVDADVNYKVLFITYYWPPSGGAGVQRCLKFVKYLPAFGIEPTVITVDEKVASYAVKDETLQAEVPAGVRVFRTNTSEPFEAYKKISGKKEIPYGGFANSGKEGLMQKVFKFLRGNLFIPDARVGWNKHALKQIESLLKNEQFDAIITSSPPHSTQLIGLKLKKKYNIRWIADLRDPWTDIYYYKDLNHIGLTKNLDEKYEREVLENADELVVVSDDIKRILQNKVVHMDPHKIHVLPNGYDEDDFIYQSTPPTDEILITYTGTITEVYNIETFLMALAEMMRRHPDIKYKLRFVGKISEGVREQLEVSGVMPITEILPYVPHAESIQYLMRSTVLLMAIPDVPNNFGILTGKLFEYLASNKPIICIGPIHSDADRIIDECGAGRVLHYAGYELMLDHLDLISQNWKVNPNQDLPFINYVQYSRKELTSKLAEMIRGK